MSKIIKLYALLVLFLFSEAVFAMNQTIIIDSTQLRGHWQIRGMGENLGYFEIGCGKKCLEVEISSIPHSTKGTLNIDIYLPEGCKNTARLPFISSNDQLNTPITTYHLEFPDLDDFCEQAFIDVMVLKNPNKASGYLVKIIQK